MDTDPVLGFSVLALAVALATALATSVARWRNRPRRPSMGPASDDLGVEPVAIVDLLTDDFAVTAASVPATVLDLAVRKWLTVEEVAGGNVIVRLRGRRPTDLLTPYEERVLDHLRHLAVDGVIPAAAMTTGAGDASKRWWRDFRGEVIADAQERGLCRPRWSARAMAPLWLGVFAAAGALWAAERLGDQTESGAGVDSSGWIWGVALVVTVAVGMWLLTLPGRDLQRDTDAGLAAAGRWLGVRDYLDTVGDFSDKSAASVVLWERQLALAVALDLAPAALKQLPMGAEDHRHCWSRASGFWRQVQVRYPRMRPGYGQHPLLAVLGAIVVGGAAAVVVGLVGRVLGDDVGIVEDVPASAAGVVDVIALVVGALAVVVAAWNLVKLVAALGDFVAVDTLDGVLIRRRARWGLIGLHEEGDKSSHDRAKSRFFCALDTGQGDTVVAWRVREQLYNKVRQGERHRARVTRRLRYVRSLEPAGVEVAEDAADEVRRRDP